MVNGDPFERARTTCFHAAKIARDVSIDEKTLTRFTDNLDVERVRNIMTTFTNENCDTVPGEFRGVRDAVNFAVLFSLLQFGHGFRYELHQYCGRGASQTVTMGVRALHASGDLNANRLERLTVPEIGRAFQLPNITELEVFIHQLFNVVHPLPRGPLEAELRAVSLAACEKIVTIAGDAFSALELGYYLWLQGKEPNIRQYARHHTKNTVFY